MRQVFLILAGLLLSPQSDQLPGCAPPAVRTEILAEFPMPGNGEILTVPVTIRGQEYPFLIDTGTSKIVYDQSFADQLGPILKTSRMLTPNGETRVQCYAAPEAMLGALSLRTDDVVVCADLSFFERLGRGRIYGMIGMSWLKNYALTLDFSHKKIQLRHEVSIDDRRALLIPPDRHGVPSVEVVPRGDDPRSLVVDTGSLCPTTIDRATFDRLRRVGLLRSTYPVIMKDLGREDIVRTGILRSVQVAGVNLPRIAVNETSSDRGVLGMDTIRRLDWVLDFPRQRMMVTRAY